MPRVLKYLFPAIFFLSVHSFARTYPGDILALMKVTDSMEKKGVQDSIYVNKILVLTAKLKFIDPDLGLSYLRKTLKPASLLEDKRFLCNVYYQIGQQYAAKGHTMLALDNYIVSYKTLPTEQERIEHGGFILLDIGNSYYKQKNFRIAQTFFEKSLHNFKTQHVEDGIKVAISNIALVKNQLNQLDSALLYFNKVIQLAIASKDSIRIAYNFGWLGDVYFKKKQFSECQKWYQQALSITLLLPGSLEDKQLIASLNIRIGNALLAQQKIWPALEHYKYAVKVTRPISDFQNLFGAYSALSNAYTQMNDDILALKYIDSAYAVSTLKGSAELKKDAVIQQCKLLISLGRNNEAREKINEYHQLLDSIANDESLRKVSELNTVMETFQLQAKNESLIHEKQERITYLLVVIMVLSIILVLIFIMLNNKRINELKLKKIAADLQQANATKDKFFSIIAHDLRGPMHTIMGFSELLSTEYTKYSDAEKHHFVSTIHNLTLQLNRLLQNLLEWSRVQIGTVNFRPEIIHLGTIADETCALLAEAAQKKQISVINAIEKDHHVIADENMLKVVMRNLLSNAVKFTYSNGRVRIGTYREKEDIVIVVEDNGMGIPPDDIDRVFRIGEDVGREGTAREKSTGLGLILCKEFVEKCGGHIWVESTQHSGSRFFFTLPAATSP